MTGRSRTLRTVPGALRDLHALHRLQQRARRHRAAAALVKAARPQLPLCAPCTHQRIQAYARGVPGPGYPARALDTLSGIGRGCTARPGTTVSQAPALGCRLGMRTPYSEDAVRQPGRVCEQHGHPHGHPHRRQHAPCPPAPARRISALRCPLAVLQAPWLQPSCQPVTTGAVAQLEHCCGAASTNQYAPSALAQQEDCCSTASTSQHVPSAVAQPGDCYGTVSTVQYVPNAVAQMEACCGTAGAGQHAPYAFSTHPLESRAAGLAATLPHGPSETAPLDQTWMAGPGPAQ